MEFFVVLTLGRAVEMITVCLTVASDGAATRQECLDHARETVIERSGRDWATAPVVFFSAEPSAMAG